jgi:hypothetical protein
MISIVQSPWPLTITDKRAMVVVGIFGDFQARTVIHASHGADANRCERTGI